MLIGLELNMNAVKQLFIYLYTLSFFTLMAEQPIQYYCTAADEGYFYHVINLIGSLHKTNFEHLGEIIIFDLGLTAQQKTFLEKIQKVCVRDLERINPYILQKFQVNKAGKMVPGWYSWKPVCIKQALEIYPYVLWLDAGTTILRDLSHLFAYIKNNHYLLITIGDEYINDKLAHPIKQGLTKFVQEMFCLNTQDPHDISHLECIGSLIGVHKEASDLFLLTWYEFAKNIKYFQDDGTTPDGFGTARHDQIILSILTYILGLQFFKQDYTQKKPILLNNQAFYITWNRKYVDSKTHIFNSRQNLFKEAMHKEALKMKDVG